MPQCDLRIPSCWRCEKAGLSCQGYNKPPVFVNCTVTDPGATAVLALSKARVHRIRPTPQPPSNPYEIFLGLKRNLEVSVYCPFRFRLQAWELLKQLYLPQPHSTLNDDLVTTTPYSWLHAVCHLSIANRVLDQSLLAFCAIQISIAEPWSISGDEASMAYSDALPELVQIIGDDKDQNTDGVLAAIAVLSTCEVCR